MLIDLDEGLIRLLEKRDVLFNLRLVDKDEMKWNDINALIALRIHSKYTTTLIAENYIKESKDD